MASESIQTKEEVFSRYAALFSSPDPNDKLLALGQFIFFINSAETDFLLSCALATDFVFIDRMLRNGRRLSDIADKVDVKLNAELADENASQLQELAIAVLTVFVQLPDMTGRPEMYERIPVLVAILEKTYAAGLTETHFRDQSSWTHILDILRTLSTVRPGADLLLTPPCVSTLLKLVPLATTKLPDILHLLTTALQNSTSPVKSEPILKHLAGLFATSKSFFLVSHLIPFFTTIFDSTPPSPSLHVPLYHGIKNLTLSKIDDKTRIQLTILQGLLLAYLGPEFLFSPPPSENVKQTALLSIRLASSGCQSILARYSNASLEAKRCLIAQMEILHATTNWLLWPNESYSIAGGKLNTDEILQIQDWMVSAIRDISVFLREKYDVMRVEGIVSFEEYLDAVVRTAVKTVCGWYAEDGGEGSLGLLDVLVAVCATNDVELITWAMRGIRGIIEHMDKGADELWSLKDGLLMLLDCVYDSVKSAKETRMAREVCMLFQSLVDMQPLCLTEPTIRSFPAKLMDSLPLGTTDTAHWHAKTNASDLAVQILFKMMNDGDAAEKRASQKMLKKYMSRMVQLFHSSARPKDPQEVSSLASALEELQF